MDEDDFSQIKRDLEERLKDVASGSQLILYFSYRESEYGASYEEFFIAGIETSDKKPIYKTRDYHCSNEFFDLAIRIRTYLIDRRFKVDVEENIRGFKEDDTSYEEWLEQERLDSINWELDLASQEDGKYRIPNTEFLKARNIDEVNELFDKAGRMGY